MERSRNVCAHPCSRTDAILRGSNLLRRLPRCLAAYPPGKVVVGVRIASVSRVRNFSARIVARSFHNACRAACNAPRDAAGLPPLLCARNEDSGEGEEKKGACERTRRGKGRKKRRGRNDGRGRGIRGIEFFVMRSWSKPRSSGSAGEYWDRWGTLLQFLVA